MKQAKIFRQYAWLVSTLQQHGRLTLEELRTKWAEDETGDRNQLTRTTFNRHRDDIADMFGLVIECDREYRYYICNPSAVGDRSIERWMLSTLTVSGVLLDSASLKDRILLEDVPAGEEYLPTIIRAIKMGRKIEMGYQRFGGEPYEKTVTPLALKLSERRWYLLADNGERMATYSLDRIHMVRLSSETFTLPEDFSAQRFYGDYYGVLADGTPMEHVVVRAYGNVPSYLRTLPLHDSQREVNTTDDYADFALDIRPTNDFIGKLFSFDAYLEVLQPQSLRQRCLEKLEEMAQRYRTLEACRWHVET